MIRAAQYNSFKTASLIIDHIFNLEGRNIYQDEIMKSLPLILNEEKIASKIVKFFDLPDIDDKVQNHLSFEQLLKENNTPAFSTEEWFVHETQAYDFCNYKVELSTQLNEIADKRTEEFEKKLKAEQEEGKKKKSDNEEEATETLYDITNTFIDFRAMILSLKF